MSKHLDEEYKKMIAAEVPDLWNRIEANLPEKQIAKTGENADATEKSENINAVQPAPKKKKPVIFKILPWAGAATAAALLLMVALPAILLSNLGKKNQKSAAAMAMNTMHEAAYEATYEEPAFADTDYAEDDGRTLGVTENMDSFQNYAVQSGQANIRTGSENYDSFKADLTGAVPAEEAETETDLAEAGAEAGMQQQKKLAGSLNGETEDEDFEFYVRIESILINGQNFFTCSASMELEDFSNPDLAMEVFGVELSDESEVKAEIGSVYLAKFDDDDYLILLEKME